MTGVAFVADLHLGAGAGRLEAQREAWLEAVGVVNTEAESLVIAGDVFHRARPTPDELDAFVDGVEQLEVPVVAIPGNHDFSNVSETTALEVILRGRSGMQVARYPQTFERPGYTLAVLPWSPLHPMAEDLLAAARALYLNCPADVPCALALHWSIGGSVMPNGRRIEDVTRETMLPRAELETLGFDAVIAGHIHNAQSLGGGFVPIEYVGSLVPVDHSEADGRHGVLVWTPESSSIERFELEHGPRFVTLDLDELAGGDYDEEDVTGAIVRVRYTASRDEHRRIEAAHIFDQLSSAGEVAVQPTIIREENARGAALGGDVSPVEAMQAWLVEQAGISPELGELMLAETSRYVDELAGGAS